MFQIQCPSYPRMDFLVKPELEEGTILLSNSHSSPLICELESVRVGGRGREESGEVLLRCREGGVSRAHMTVLAIASPMIRWLSF